MVGLKEWDGRAFVFAFFSRFFLGGSFVLVGSQDMIVAGSRRLLGVRVQHCSVLRNGSGGFSELSTSRTSSFIFVPTVCLLGKCCYGPLASTGSGIRWTLDQTFAGFYQFSSELIFVLWSDQLSIVFFSRRSTFSPHVALVPRAVLYYY